MMRSGGICARVLCLVKGRKLGIHVMRRIEAYHVCLSCDALRSQ